MHVGNNEGETEKQFELNALNILENHACIVLYTLKKNHHKTCNAFFLLQMKDQIIWNSNLW